MARFKKGEICKIGYGKFKGQKVKIIDIWPKTINQYYVIQDINGDEDKEYYIDERDLEKIL